VEAMRNGMSPKDAGMTALKRVVANTVEERLLNSRGQPNFNVRYYALNAAGDYAGVSLYEFSEQGKRTLFALCDENGPRTVPAEALLSGRPDN
jgi:N4-(beta-N-acetylglucosaminyl)-L-asparaginase